MSTTDMLFSYGNSDTFLTDWPDFRTFSAGITDPRQTGSGVCAALNTKRNHCGRKDRKSHITNPLHPCMALANTGTVVV